MNIQPFPIPREQNPVTGRCSKCGRELRPAMWVSCGNSPCPSGLGSRVSL